MSDADLPVVRRRLQARREGGPAAADGLDRIALFSDVRRNLTALEAMLADIDRRGTARIPTTSCPHP